MVAFAISLMSVSYDNVLTVTEFDKEVRLPIPTTYKPAKELLNN